MSYRLWIKSLYNEKRRQKTSPLPTREDFCFDYFLRVIILVMACLMTTPAFSVSFFDRPVVTQTLTAD